MSYNIEISATEHWQRLHVRPRTHSQYDPRPPSFIPNDSPWSSKRALDQVHCASDLRCGDLIDDGVLLFEPDPKWSFVVKGGPLWDSDPEVFKSQYELQLKIEEDLAAVKCLDLSMA